MILVMCDSVKGEISRVGMKTCVLVLEHPPCFVCPGA